MVVVKQTLLFDILVMKKVWVCQLVSLTPLNKYNDNPSIYEYKVSTIEW